MPALLNQNPLLTLDALAPCGVVLPTEVSAALDVSLNLKARELGVQGFLFWGRLSTLSGKDYYIARAYNGTKRVDGKVLVNPGNKFYYSQDGVNWLDLEPVVGVQAGKAAKLDCELSRVCVCVCVCVCHAFSEREHAPALLSHRRRRRLPNLLPLRVIVDIRS